MSDIEHHMRSFADAFDLEGRRDKWINLLSERPDTILGYSSKLFNYFNHNYIEQNDTVGVYYDFVGEPRCMSFKDANKAEKNDAIFSIKPGELVVYYFSDGWNFVCKK